MDDGSGESVQSEVVSGALAPVISDTGPSGGAAITCFIHTAAGSVPLCGWWVWGLLALFWGGGLIGWIKKRYKAL